MRATEAARRVVTVLDLLGESADGIGVQEVARSLDVHPSTASRLLATLGASGIVERDPGSKRYRIGARVVGLAAAMVDRLPVVSQARPQLEHLSAATSETANLAIRDGFHVVYVDQVTPAQTVVMASWVGRRSPGAALQAGQVLAEAVERALVEMAVVVQPGADIVEGCGAQVRRPLLRAAPARHQARTFEHLEMLADRLQ